MHFTSLKKNPVWTRLRELQLGQPVGVVPPLLRFSREICVSFFTTEMVVEFFRVKAKPTL
jgi:hypothetical protein